MSKGRELVSMLNEQLGLEMDDLAKEFMGSRFDNAYFDQQEAVDAIGAHLYLASWDESVAFSDIQALEDDPYFGKYFTGELDFDAVYTVTEDQLREAVEDGSYAIEQDGIEYTFEDSEYNIDISQVTDMSGLFEGSPEAPNDFNRDIGYWDVSNVEDMHGMFTYAESFNQDIGDWDVSNVQDMSSMFYHADSFDQNLSGWSVPQIEEKPENFADNSPLEEKDEWHPLWGGQEPEGLFLTLDSITTAGEVGSSVQMDAVVEHTGDAEEVEFTMSQNGESDIRTVDLQESSPAEEKVSAVFDNTWGYDAGAVDVQVSIAEGTEVETVEKTFGLYESVEDYQWQWSDTDESPFDMIGQVVVDHDGLDSGTLGIGTGFMISPKHMMTNAHVISDEDWQSDLSELNTADFYLGRNGGTVREVQDENAYSGEHAYLQKEKWSDGSWPDTDMAVITLDQEVDGHFDWFWNGREEPGRDIRGEEVIMSGYPSGGIKQGEDELGKSNFFQWNSQGTVTDYIEGYDGYGEESGGLSLSQDMSLSEGGSGSPVIQVDENGDFQFAGAYTGTLGSDSVAAALDPAAYDWALNIVQNDGYLSGLDYIDGPGAMGPDKALPDTDSALAQSAEEVVVQGIPESVWDDYSGLA